MKVESLKASDLATLRESVRAESCARRRDRFRAALLAA